MNLIKICCIKITTGSSNINSMTNFQSYEIIDHGDMIYINGDNIVSLSPITYKTISGKRYYGYYIVMTNNLRYWVKCGTNSYEYLSGYINKQKEEPIPVKPSSDGHLNYKSKK